MRAFLTASVVALSAAAPAAAQYGRPPGGFTPSGGEYHGGGYHPVGGGSSEPDGWVIALGVVGLLVVAGLAVGLRGYRKEDDAPPTRSVARIRVVAVPPGEAPEDVRRAWVGVVLPVSAGDGPARPRPAVGVVTGEPVDDPSGYPVDGAEAVAALAAKDAAAAALWRRHAPHVLARGYQLVFPCEVAVLVTEDELLGGDRAGVKGAGAGRKECGRCGGVVNVYAVRCRHCRAVLGRAG